MKFANKQHVRMMEQAFSVPRTVADACDHCGVPPALAPSAVRLLLYTDRITETADRQGRPAYVKVVR